MEYFMEILGRVAYHFDLILPIIPTELHLIVSALFPIYTGAHASLSRPSSAAKPCKREKHDEVESGEDESNGDEQKMEGLSPDDAIMFPVIAGVTLTGLYLVMKWLQDPAILNKILNWYFSVFGIISVAKLLTDSMGVMHSYVFPEKYSWDGQLWEVRPQLRKARSTQDTGAEISTPLPGLLSRLPLPASLHDALWSIRGMPSHKFDFRIFIHKITSSHFHLGPIGSFGFNIALISVLYYNLVAKPWWLTNLMGFSFAYSVLQVLSPTTFWTGTLILMSLFFYDIYFVFFTPIMVTVATTLEIPAKLLFPRPSRPDEDPGKQALSMLGLGDVVLPGIMIGLALRFDLYLFYLRKQQQKSSTEATNKDEKPSNDDPPSLEIIKAPWKTATGGWGERFWVGQANSDATRQQHGGTFPKTYFHASLTGYVLGMLCTLVIMQTYGHAQPALLYLVPGVLGSLWSTALIKGDLKTMWEFTEAEEELDDGKKGKAKGMESIFSVSRQEKIAKRLGGAYKGGDEDDIAGQNENKPEDKPEHKPEDKDKPEKQNKSKTNGESNKKPPYDPDTNNKLIYFSIALPPSLRSKNESKPPNPSSASQNKIADSTSAPIVE